MANSESYSALWRSAQNDVVPNHKDFPQWFTMLVEVLNGGKTPTNVNINLEIMEETVNFKYMDTGYGSNFESMQDRFFTWASTQSVSGDSIYGHGTKKFLAKSGDYDTLEFTIRSRAKGEKKINEWVGPYKGTKTKHDIRSSEELPDFPKHGFELEFTMDINRLGPLNTKQAAFNAIKEIICTRKKQETLDSIHYNVTVQDYVITPEIEARAHELKITVEDLFDTDDDLVQPISEDSIEDEWQSLETVLAEHGALLLDTTVDLVPGKTRLRYKSYTTLLMEQVPGFPVYGRMGGGVSTRVHAFNQNTMIEAHPWWDLMDVKVHPGKWHRIDFAYFEAIDPKNEDHVKALPQPATTKVAYGYESPAWKMFVEKVHTIYAQNTASLALTPKETLKAAAAAAAAEAAAEAAATGDDGSSGGVPLPRDADGDGEASVVGVDPSEFKKAAMDKLFKKLKNQGKEPRKFQLPKWYSCEDLIVYTEADGKMKVIFYRNRQKGDISDDLEKAYVSLSRFMNECHVAAANVEMLFCLEAKKGGDKRKAEFDTVKVKMAQAIYPNIGLINFRLVKDLVA